MGGFFYNLGRRMGPQVRKGRWLWSSLTAPAAEARRAEQAAGRDMALAMRRRYGTDYDPADRKALEEIGSVLEQTLRDRGRTFTFEPLPIAAVNAFALPGGYVFVTQGLLEACRRDRDELAFVVGHEMGHVVREHALERMVGRSALAGAVRALPAARLIGGLAGRGGLALLEKAHSREQEEEADSLGLRMAEAAGFDPLGSVRFLQRLMRPGDPPRGYLASHPDPGARIERIRSSRS